MRLVLALLTSLFSHSFPAAAQGAECVRIYYDAGPGAAVQTYVLGKTYSMYLQNLLGHFPEFQQIISPIEKYQTGDLDQCRASFYIGSYFDNTLPQAFLNDYLHTKRNVMWIGYSIWELGDAHMAEALGYTYKGMTGIDDHNLDVKHQPTFFKNILYKGETFTKYGEIVNAKFDGAPEMVALQPAASSGSGTPTTVLAEAMHNFTSERLPYAIRKDGHFYIADIPFSFIHEADRYLVFADLLFDVLNVSPRYGPKHPAAFRIEDVHACLDQENLRKIGEITKSRQIPLHVALIPIFSDPKKNDDHCPGQVNSPMTQHPEFLNTLKILKDDGAVFIWHGVTHQYRDHLNPYTGVSGDDYEFWDTATNSPVQEDSADWLLGRLDQGWGALKDAAISPTIWEVPHYRASVLDYLIFARVFPWSMGRDDMSPFTVSGQPALDQRLWYDPLHGDPVIRNAAFKQMSIQQLGPSDGDQFFPYEIYGDVFGNRLWPENLGYVTDPSPTKRVHAGLGTANNNVDEMIENIRRNSKLRDSWASFFYHPYLFLDYGPADLDRLFNAIEQSGYEFVNLEKMGAKREGVMRPQSIILE